jgi:phospholipase C
LARVFTAYRSATSESGPNVWNTPLLIGWDEPGGTYDHVPPGPVPPPDPAAPPGEFGFTFDRSGYRVPAIIVSPWVEPGSVYNEEYRHTSLIATLRKAWGLGDALTQRDAAARTFGVAPALIAKAKELGVPLPAELTEPGAELPPGQTIGVLRQVAGHFFPLPAGDATDPG